MLNTRVVRALFPIAPLLLLLAHNGLAQGKADSLEATARAYEQRLMDMEREKAQAVANFEKAAQRVHRLKEQKQGFVQRHRLEHALRELQVLAQTVEGLENQLRELRAARDSTLIALWAHYDEQASKLAKSLEKELPHLTETERLERARDLAALRRKRAEVSGRLTVVPVAPNSLPRWALSPEEDYRRLEDKAALLLDRAFRLREEAAVAGKRLKQLREEIALRQRLNELVNDVALFDQHDETITPLAKRAEMVPTEFTSDTRSGLGSTTGAHAVVAPTARPWSADPAQLSSAEAELFMRQLQAEKARLVALAGTLEARSRVLTKKATQQQSAQGPSAP
ncbi:MAG: hypothetical protein ACUVTG_03770 [Candidatus Oleimicrobiaceae bacterium]